MCVVALTVASLALTAYGQYQQGQAQKESEKFNAQVSRNNAIIAERNAKAAKERGDAEADAKRRQIASVKGQQRAAFAASGVAIDEGTPLDILADTAELGELDVLNIKNNAEREAYNYRVQAGDFTAQAGLHDASARNASTAGLINAGTTVLTGSRDIAKTLQ